MSRGFIKEDDLEHAGTDLPERLVSLHPNYVTPEGLRQLESEASGLDKERATLVAIKDDELAKQKLAVTDRDLRYLSARLEHAILVDPANQNKSTVLFGATVKVEDEEGNILQFHIVGEDEADIKGGKVSIVSPIARALIGKSEGDVAEVMAPGGVKEYEILDVSYG